MIDPSNPIPPALEALHKVLPAGGPLVSRRCPRCDLPAVDSAAPVVCPCTEEQIGSCPLKATS
jgi:uncharacterized Zn finger protein (UPF0148 family)